MPGIAGIIGQGPSEAHERLVRTMVKAMAYDDRFVSGMCSARALGLHAGWVAHRDSYAAKQCCDRRGPRWALVSGELFPTDEGDGRLSETPASSRPQRNLLLDRYEVKGIGLGEELNGLFGALLVDEERKRALLFNDRYGIERIYAYEKGESSSSPAKPKLSLAPFRKPEHGTSKGSLSFSSSAARLKAEHCSTASGSCREVRSAVRGGKSAQGSILRSGVWEHAQPLDEDTFEQRFCEVFTTRLRPYLAAKNGLGISITGGLDTRTIMACLPE